jgi:predicted SnoaL-like aldol condensation-catalyzing enzyme
VIQDQYTRSHFVLNIHILEFIVKKIFSLAIVSLISIGCQSLSKKSGFSQTDVNKKNVIEFYNLAINNKDYEAASKFIGNRYVQHNPMAKDGKEGLKNFIDFLISKFPNSKSIIKRSYAEGDYVILHVHAIREPGTLGYSIMDIYKLEEGKVVEHWDVIQPIPEKSLNDNGMF